MQEQIKILASELRLHGILDSFERRSLEATNNNLLPAEFLKMLLEDETLRRKEVKANRLLGKAKFRNQSSLEDWDQSFERGVTKLQLKELSRLGFYHNKINLIILGKTGEGKTQLAVSIGRRMCQETISATFTPVSFFFEEIAAAKAAGKYLRYIKELTRTKTIILDDFGLRNYTHEEATALLDVLEERYQKESIIITSQVDPKGWIKLFEDPVIAEAITDRLINPSQTIKLTGGSYREKLQKLKKSAKVID